MASPRGAGGEGSRFRLTQNILAQPAWKAFEREEKTIHYTAFKFPRKVKQQNKRRRQKTRSRKSKSIGSLSRRRF